MGLGSMKGFKVEDFLYVTRSHHCRSSSQQVWAGSTQLPVSCVLAPLEALHTYPQTPPPLPPWPPARAPSATLQPPPPRLSPSCPSSFTTPPPPPTAHSGQVQLTLCQTCTRLLHSLGPCWSAPRSPWGPTLHHRARSPGRGHSRLFIWPTCCRSPSATPEDPT